MIRQFKDIRVGDTIYKCFSRDCKLFIQPFKVHKIHQANDYVTMYNSKNQMTPYMLKNVSTNGYCISYGMWFTTFDECLNNLPLKRKNIINILTPNSKKVAFYDVQTKKILNNQWYKWDTLTGFYQSNKRLYGIISDNGMYNVITRDGTLLSDKWFKTLHKCIKEGYLMGVNTAIKKQKIGTTLYTVSCQEEEKITLPDSTIINTTRCKKTTRS